MSKNTVYVEVKNKRVRTVLFVLALLVAIGAFTYGVYSIAKVEPGMTVIDATLDDAVPYFSTGLEFSYDLEGTQSEMKSLKKLVTSAYTDDLKWAYRLLDAEKEYPDFINIATINANPNKEIRIPEELYEILLEADRWSFGPLPGNPFSSFLETANYNLYAGAFYKEWDTILISDNAADFDPAVNEYESNRLMAMLSVADPRQNEETPHLEFLENNTVKLVVPVSYNTFVREYEIDAPLVDLNVLRDAFLVRLTEELLERSGYDKGAFLTDSGIWYKPSAKEAVAYFEAQGFEEDGYAYRITVNGETLYRHRYVNVSSGAIDNSLERFAIRANDNDPVIAAVGRASFLYAYNGPENFIKLHPQYTVEYVLR